MNLTITEVRRKIESREAEGAEIFSSCFAKVKEKDEEIHAFLSTFKTPEASRVEGVLSGVPIAVKDNILVSGSLCTAGSKILSSYTAAYDATAIERIKASGATIIGKTNLDEFAMGSSTENSAFGPTKNPHDTTRVPGGSSGGSAAAVAAGMCVAALGSDTGGSVRQPAALCGVVGLKPTYGAVSRHGLIALASSLDQIGTLTNSVEDAETLLSVIGGNDPYDATSLPDTHEKRLLPPIDKIRIGLPREYFAGPGLDPDVAKKVREAVAWFESEGAKIKEVSLPHTSHALATYYVIVPAEASSNLARYEGLRYGEAKEGGDLWDQYRNTRGELFGEEPKRRIMIGTYVLSSGYYDAYYKKAVAARTYIKKDFEEAFGEVDVIMTPTTPTVAFKLGEKANDPLAMYASDVFTVPSNIAGTPAISIPCGTGEGGLPVGLQIISPWRREDLLFMLGKAFESR